MQLHTAHTIMLRGLDERLFTGAGLMVVRGGEALHSQTYGTLGGPGTADVTADTLFDLASLTKILATTPLWVLLTTGEAEILDQSISRWFPAAPPNKHGITPRHLLAHASGLPHWRPYYLTVSMKTQSQGKDFFAEKSPPRSPSSKSSQNMPPLPPAAPGRMGTQKDGKSPTAPAALIEETILGEKLLYQPGSGCLYSDLGFMLLAFIIEQQTGKGLAEASDEDLFEPLGLSSDLMFKPEGEAERTALTRPGEPHGLVNDLNCRSLGGVAGHAGLFGTAKGVAALAGEILCGLKRGDGFFNERVMSVFCTRAGFTPDSTRALGFDTPSAEGSTSGALFPPTSLGHTGFTGTSLWIDPESETIVVLLTNRVFMGEADMRIKTFRPELHDAVMRESGG
jgi:serine-type D-Ala-D-Ala carboxypeptidase